MRRLHPSRVSPIAIATAGMALLLSGSAWAQSIQVFDDAPPIEQLRSIMIPESPAGVGRTIVVQHPGTGLSSQAVQRVTTQAAPATSIETPMPAPAHTSMPAPASADPVEQSPSPVQEAAAGATVPPAPAAVRPNHGAKPHTVAMTLPDVKPGTVGFRINFAFDSAVLPDSAHAMIDRVAEVLKEAPDIKVRVEGHTDAIGSADYNVSLSERRALSVGEYLVKLGIEPSRLELVGKGMAEPLTHNPYDPSNRRVQFVRVS